VVPGYPRAAEINAEEDHEEDHGAEDYQIPDVIGREIRSGGSQKILESL